MKPNQQKIMNLGGSRARAPGKVILGGEHAVVAGRHALLAAVNLYLEVCVRPRADGLLNCETEDLGHAEPIHTAGLPTLREDLDRRRRAYLSGDLAVEQILDSPLQLVQYAAALAWDHGGLTGEDGLSIALRSQLQAGSGLGSSAAAVLAVLTAVGAWSGNPMAREALQELAQRAEGLQHGRPSGADSYAVLHGGLVRYARDDAPCRLPASIPVGSLVFTGTPDCSTGTCVETVRQRFPAADGIWDEFEAVVQTMERALADGKEDAWCSAVREHHRLLRRIGVVPESTAWFIDQVEQAGGAAKVCGAGAVQGEAAGVLLAVGDPEQLRCLSREQGYRWVDMEMDHDGTQLL